MRFWALVLALSLCACRTGEVASESQTKELTTTPPLVVRQPEEALAFWRSHVDEAERYHELQADCRPRHITPPVDRPTVGLVVLVHGYSACPQQFFKIGQALAELGYEVFLPLLPGHGRMPLADLDLQGQRKDNLNGMPKDGKWQPYQDLAWKMNRMAAVGIGTRIVGGLSGGANVAMASAADRPSAWDRAVFFAPFIEIPGFNGPLSAFMDVVFPQFKTNWGPTCKAERGQPGGRHGICTATVDMSRTMRSFGDSAASRANLITAQTMFVGAEADPTADNGAVFEAYSRVRNARICFYRKGVPHAMISDFDHKGKPHFWARSLESDAINFIANGVWFPTEAMGTSTEYGQARCVIVE
jgi:esterase/lipase